MLFLFLTKSEFGQQILAKIPNVKFQEVHPAGAKLFHVDKYMSITHLIHYLQIFCERT
jgi:hypothetical protein